MATKLLDFPNLLTTNKVNPTSSGSSLINAVNKNNQEIVLYTDNEDSHDISIGSLFLTLPLKNQNSKTDLNYYQKLCKFKRNANKNFSIIHININSLFYKIQELSQIQNMEFDLITINETKFDDTIQYHYQDTTIIIIIQ